MKRLVLALFVLLVVCAGAAGAWLWQFAHAPMAFPKQPFDLRVKPGSGVSAVARQLVEQGALKESWRLRALARLAGNKEEIKSGVYRFDNPLTPIEFLDKLRRGEVRMAQVRLVEGQTYVQLLKRLAEAEDLVATEHVRDWRTLAEAVGAREKHPEGLFFPDTYFFTPGDKDIDILKRAYTKMRSELETLWVNRDASLPYASIYEALIMASIVEKETGREEERPLIASVFVNRLRKPMRLQTDPTVIYGMGDTFDGDLRRRDLSADTPYNTYTRDGLPPTPIAMPGLGSLKAAMQPAKSDYLYFVAKGDGAHQFSRTLNEHNVAVNRYQRRQ